MVFAMELKLGVIPRLECVPPPANPLCSDALYPASVVHALPTSPTEMGTSTAVKELTFGRLVMNRSARNPGYRSENIPKPPRITVVPALLYLVCGVYAKPTRGPHATFCMFGNACSWPVNTAWL